MTDTAEFPYRLATGWITQAALEASSAYLLTAFPVQTDQKSSLLNPWGPPDDDSTFPEYTRYGEYSNKTQWSDGPQMFFWSLKYFTENMVVYWENLIYASLTVQSAPVTVKTRKHNGVFGVYQGYANRAKPNKDYKRGTRGLLDYRQYFDGLIEI